MKRVEINEEKFKQMMKIAKACVAHEDIRPQLKYIQLKVEGKLLTAYSLDGYRASKVEIELDSEFEAFTCFIKPMTIKTSKQKLQNVIVEFDDKYAYVEVSTDYGKLKYTFTQPDGSFIDIEKIYRENKEHDREHAIKASYLADAAKALSNISLYRGQCVVIESKEDVVKPIIIRAKGCGIKSEQLILPMRVVGDEA